MKYLLTGACGFIGSHVLDALLASEPSAEVVNLDALTYAGNNEWHTPRSLSDRYQFIHGSICDPVTVKRAMRGVKVVIHLAAETHVDRSIADGAPFLRTNVLGTHCLLEEFRQEERNLFLQVSTDEVLGPDCVPLPSGSPLRPQNPYAVSKAAAEHLIAAYQNTYGINANVIRLCNVYGPRQYPEKLLPVAIACVLRGDPVPVYGDGQQRREWLYVTDAAQAILTAVRSKRLSVIYQATGNGLPITNNKLLRMLFDVMDGGTTAAVPDRPGHDRSYSMARYLPGWEPTVPLAEGLGKTVDWYTQSKRRSATGCC